MPFQGSVQYRLQGLAGEPKCRFRYRYSVCADASRERTAKRLAGCILYDWGQHGMFTFRTSITFAVMAFIVALAVLLIAIQVRALRWATHEAASAYMDATSAKALGRLRTEISRHGVVGKCAGDQLQRGRFK